MNKRLYTALWMTLTLIFSATWLTSCSDDNNSTPSALSVEKSDVSFPPQGGVGEILLSTTPEWIKASDDWCEVSMADNKITVSVGRHTSFEARNAIVTAGYGKDSVIIPVHQDGAIWNLAGNDTYEISTDDRSVMLLPIRLDYDYEVKSSAPEWLYGEMTDEGYAVTIDDNYSGARRTATLTFSGEPGERTYTFTQFGLRVIEGTYEASFCDTTEDTSFPLNTERDVTIRLLNAERYEFGIYGLCDDPNIAAVMVYDPVSHNMTLIPGQGYKGGETTIDGTKAYGYCGIVGYNYDDILVTYTPFKQDYIFTMDETTGMPYFEFYDNGTWNGLVQNGFRIDLMPNESPSDYNKLATLTYVLGLRLKKKK